MGWFNQTYWDERKKFLETKRPSGVLTGLEMELCRFLGYETRENQKNFCCGRRIAKYSDNKPQWESGTVYKTFMNKDGILDSYEAKLYPKYNKHILTPIGKRIGLKKLPDINYPDEFKKAFALNVRGCVNTYGLRRRELTDIISIDIDKAVADRMGLSSTFLVLEKINKILKVSYNDYLYIEYNKLFDGGLHCFIQAPYELNSSEMKRLENYVSGKLGEHIEIDFTNKILRLPMSYEYYPVILSKCSDLVKFVKVVDVIPEEYFYSSYEKAYKSVKKKPIKLDRCEFFKKHLYSADQAVEEELKKKEIKRDKVIYVIRTKPQFDLERFKKEYVMEKGTSWEETKKLVPYLSARGVSFDSLLSFMECVGKDTKRYSRLSKSGKTSLKRFYEKCVKTAKANPTIYSTKDVNGYFSNQSFLTDKEMKLFSSEHIGEYLYEKMINVVSALIDGNCNKSLMETCIALKKEKYKNELIEELPLFAIEYIGKYRWMKKNGVKSIYKDHPEYDGLQMPTELMEKISEFVIQKTNPLYHKFNSKQFRVILMMTFGLEMKQNRICSKLKPYHSGFCAFWGNSFADVFEPFLKEIENEFGESVNEIIEYIDVMTGEILDVPTIAFSHSNIREALIHHGFNLTRLSVYRNGNQQSAPPIFASD